MGLSKYVFTFKHPWILPHTPQSIPFHNFSTLTPNTPPYLVTQEQCVCMASLLASGFTFRPRRLHVLLLLFSHTTTCTRGKFVNAAAAAVYACTYSVRKIGCGMDVVSRTGGNVCSTTASMSASRRLIHRLVWRPPGGGVHNFRSINICAVRSLVCYVFDASRRDGHWPMGCARDK